MVRDGIISGVGSIWTHQKKKEWFPITQHLNPNHGPSSALNLSISCLCCKESRATTRVIYLNKTLLPVCQFPVIPGCCFLLFIVTLPVAPFLIIQELQPNIFTFKSNCRFSTRPVCNPTWLQWILINHYLTVRVNGKICVDFIFSHPEILN